MLGFFKKKKQTDDDLPVEVPLGDAPIEAVELPSEVDMVPEAPLEVPSEIDVPVYEAEQDVIGAVEEDVEPEQTEAVVPTSKSWFGKLKQALSGSTRQVANSITGIFTQKKLDDALLEELEDALIMADMGVEASNRLVEALRKEKFDKDITEEDVRQFFAARIAEKIEPLAKPLELAHTPTVIMMVGVNGTGKTTTIGKLASQWKGEGKKVMVAAADTFRAAAVEQLQVWAERAGCELVTGAHEADPASVAYQALERAKAEKADILLIDTAGRLQNKAQLMEELKKIRRVLQKQDDTTPHATILVLDATVGQNAHSQVKTFQEMVDITGLMITKLDGSAKAGVLVALAEDYELPVHAIGVGESIDDLQPFTAQQYANALMGLYSISYE